MVSSPVLLQDSVSTSVWGGWIKILPSGVIERVTRVNLCPVLCTVPGRHSRQLTLLLYRGVSSTTGNARQPIIPTPGWFSQLLRGLWRGTDSLKCSHENDGTISLYTNMEQFLRYKTRWQSKVLFSVSVASTVKIPERYTNTCLYMLRWFLEGSTCDCHKRVHREEIEGWRLGLEGQL